jgi:hypothetical protein
VFAGPTPNQLAPDAPQRDKVQGVAGVNIGPQRIQLGAGPFEPVADFFDLLVALDFDAAGYVVMHEAEMQDDGAIVIKRDLFGKGDFPHTWAGWPIPGEPPLGLSAALATPNTVVLTAKEKKALALIHAQRKR